MDCEAEGPKRSRAKEEEEKEQCSPVSVLDPPFNDDDDNESHNPEDEGDFDYECSYAIVQSKCLMAILSTRMRVLNSRKTCFVVVLVEWSLSGIITECYELVCLMMSHCPSQYDGPIMVV